MAWLEELDGGRDQVMPVLERTCGKTAAKLWRRRWRMFFLACAELFGYRDGAEWGVSHYLLLR